MADEHNAVHRSSAPCTCCGKEGYWTSYMAGPEKARIDRDGVCFGCAFWSVRADLGCETVIDGAIYSPGNRTSGPMRGMAGRRFDIEYIASGKRITTFDLWSGGVVPERWRHRFPDTARFLNGAERAQVGETTCWDASSSASPPYPLPNGRTAP